MEREQEVRTGTTQDTADVATETEEQSTPQTQFRSSGEIPAVASASTAHAASASERAYAADTHHHGIPGGDRNVSMVGINHHPGHDSKGHGKQYTRVLVHGHEPKLGKHARIFTSDGHAIGELEAGTHVPVNAGQICHLKIEGHEHPVSCVLAHGHPPGWVPVSAFEHHGELAHIQHAQAHKIAHQQHNKPHAHGTPRTIRNKTIPADIDKLYTKPHQQSEGANHAHDYFIRGDGRANLLLNMPTWDTHGHSKGERLGSASDVVQAAEVGAEPNSHQVFHQTGSHVQVPLYNHGENHAVDHIRFVYGYVINSAGEHRYGWMNAFLLD
ncbi:MAG TPA: hypothetical protein VMZ53_24035 [Kofleriaceae bacterium]|nr:hypothetical protein [Kofleriaceae bacterium]